MKFFHLSDLHIGLRLMNYDLQEDQEYILRQIVQLAGDEKPDAVVIAGDIYDKAVPSAEAVELFDHFLSELVEALPDAVIMIISGNHDSAPRLNVFRSVLKRQHVHMIGVPPLTQKDRIETVTLRDEWGEVRFYLLPFVKPSMVKQITGTDKNGNNLSYDETLRRLLARETIDGSQRNVLVSHQFYLPPGTEAEKIERMDSEVVTVGNIDEVHADVLEPFDYAALGHIHKAMKVGKEVWRYSGTPLACSVSEAGQEKGIPVVELREKGTVKIRVLPLHPLREVRVLRGSLEELLRQGCADYVTAVLTDRIDLDILDMQDRLRTAFPNLLEIRREVSRKADYTTDVGESLADPFTLCCSFLKDPDEEEKELLRDVLNTVKAF